MERGKIMRSVAVFLMIDPPPDESGRGQAVLELDLLEGGGTDRGIMGSGVVNVGVCHVVGNRVQDAQQFGTVGGTVQESSRKVGGHVKMVQGLLGVFQGAPVPMSQAAIRTSSSQRANSRISLQKGSKAMERWASAFRIAALHWAAISSMLTARSVAGLQRMGCPCELRIL